ncbi:MAG: ATP-dependent DNA helicase [Ilumatobacteraceae bacterium]
MTTTDDRVIAALARVTHALPAAEDRPGQQQMAIAIANAIRAERHLIVQAGTGTGKTMGYLVPAVLAGKKVVVATATKALQDQLATKDLPFLDEHLAAAGGHSFEWAVLKGRSNYVCLQRLRETQDGTDGQLELEELAPVTKVEIKRVATWAATSDTGDLADAPFALSDTAQRAVTVGSDECPGATRCPLGGPCFAERARQRATTADVVVVNMHLYGLHVASGGVLLPEHDVLVVDEAHQLEDIMSDTVGLQIGPSRFTVLAGALRRILDDTALIGGVADAAAALRGALAPRAGERLPDPLPVALHDVLVHARGRIEAAQAGLRAIDTALEDAKQRKLRAQTLAGRLQDDIDSAIGSREGYVAFVSGSPEHPRLEVAPLDVGPVLENGIWTQRTAILTSATIPSSLARRVGLAEHSVDSIDVGSPFDYEHHALLYCALHLPDPRAPGRDAAAHDEIATLIEAAGGRTLALFTSWKAMDAAAAAVRGRVPHTILTQRDLPKSALVQQFSADESTCLFATAGFFQGIDIPGRTLSLVIIDRIPFPRPDDPLLSARRERLGPRAFVEIDVPRAGILLAQATGRLIRTATDRGVVAVLDRRLGTASYRWDIVRALPPMRRTRHRAEATAFLHEITQHSDQVSSR